MNYWREFIQLWIPLTIIADPLGNLPFFLLFTRGESDEARRRTALVAAGGAAAILLIFSLTGDAFLIFFGIGLPSFQLAGGVILFLHALQMLHLIPQGIKTSSEEEEEGISKQQAGLVPLATPLVAGPGAITAILVWRQQAPDAGLLLDTAIVCSCLVVYVAFRSAYWLREVLGVSGIRAASRLMGLLLAVIAVQFVVDGILALAGRGA